MKLPEKLGEAIDLFKKVRDERLDMTRRMEDELAKIKQFENEAHQHILAMLHAQGLTGSRGESAQVSITIKTMPLVRDWDLLFDHIRETGSFELVQKRIGVTAWRERFDEGTAVPGVEVVKEDVLHLTKV
jgi:hypothetical protein